MVDREVYERQILNYNLRSDYFNYTTPGTYLFEEALWSGGLSILTRDIGLPPSAVFFAITLAYMVTAALFIERYSSLRYVLLLVNPILIDLAWSQLRLALALVVLGLPLVLRKMPRPLAMGAYVAAPFIHTASLLIIVLYAAARLTRTTDADTDGRRAKIAAALVGVGLAVALATGPLREAILSQVGDRRIIYPDMSISIRYLSFWVFMFVVMLYDYRNTTQSLAQRLSLATLAVVMASALWGGYPLRFIAAGFPFIVCSMARATGLISNYLVLAFVLYALVQWAFWMNVM
jgi:hypothetical protein